MTTLTFTHPEFLLFFIAIPLLIIAHIYLLRFTKKKGMHFSNFNTLQRVTGKEVVTRNSFMLVLRLITFSLMVLALAQPIYLYEGAQKTTDYVIAIDVSGTMTTNDLGPTRFEVAKDVALDFVEGLDNANVGIISYAGLITIHQPLTNDLELVKQTLSDMDIPRLSGTDLGSALVTSSNLLLGSDQGRAIILLTDGGATVSSFAVDPLMQGTRYAKQNRVTVHSIGIGQDNQALVGYLPTIYNLTAEYHEDNLRYIAEETGGEYIHIQHTDDIAPAVQSLMQESESRLQELSLSFVLLIAALALLFFEWGLVNTRFRLIP